VGFGADRLLVRLSTWCPTRLIWQRQSVCDFFASTFPRSERKLPSNTDLAGTGGGIDCEAWRE
jgi:hypothetical protein